MQRTGSFAPLLASSLEPLTHSLRPHCSLRSRSPLRSFVRSLAHSLAPKLMGKKFLSIERMRRFHTISTHSAIAICSRRKDARGISHAVSRLSRRRYDALFPPFANQKSRSHCQVESQSETRPVVGSLCHLQHSLHPILSDFTRVRVKSGNGGRSVFRNQPCSSRTASSNNEPFYPRSLRHQNHVPPVVVSN